MAAGLRHGRAVVLIAGALIAVAVVSFGYLRQPAPASPAVVRAPAVQHPESFPLQRPNVSGDTVGGYFVWVMPGSGSGGHA